MQQHIKMHSAENTKLWNCTFCFNTFTEDKLGRDWLMEYTCTYDYTTMFDYLFPFFSLFSFHPGFSSLLLFISLNYIF